MQEFICVYSVLAGTLGKIKSNKESLMNYKYSVFMLADGNEANTLLMMNLDIISYLGTNNDYL